MNEAIKSAPWNPKLTLLIYAQSSKASRSEGNPPRFSCASMKAKAKAGEKRWILTCLFFSVILSFILYLYLCISLGHSLTLSLSLSLSKIKLTVSLSQQSCSPCMFQKQAHDCMFLSEENNSGHIHICPRRRIPHRAFLAFSRNRRGPMAHLLLKILLQIPCTFSKRTYSYLFLCRMSPGSCFWTRSELYCIKTVMDIEGKRHRMASVSF